MWGLCRGESDIPNLDIPINRIILLDIQPLNKKNNKMDWTQTFTIITTTLAATLGSTTFLYLMTSKRIDHIEVRFLGMDEQFIAQDKKWAELFISMDQNRREDYKHIDNKWERLFERFAAQDNKLEKLTERLTIVGTQKST